MSATARAQLISDVFSLSRGTYLSAELALELCEYLKTESDYLPWAIFLNRIKYYVELLDLTEINGELTGFLRELVEPIYKKLGWEAKRTDSWTDGLATNHHVKEISQPHNQINGQS